MSKTHNESYNDYCKANGLPCLETPEQTAARMSDSAKRSDTVEAHREALEAIKQARPTEKRKVRGWGTDLDMRERHHVQAIDEHECGVRQTMKAAGQVLRNAVMDE